MISWPSSKTVQTFPSTRTRLSRGQSGEEEPKKRVSWRNVLIAGVLTPNQLRVRFFTTSYSLPKVLSPRCFLCGFCFWVEPSVPA